MSITREQVADLQPGDVVEYRRDDWPEGCYVHSPLKGSYGMDSGLYVLDGHFGVRTPDGRPSEDMATLTVISRAPRPLYVNHWRTEAAEGDIVRDCDGDAWRFEHGIWWCASEAAREDDAPDALPIDAFRPLALLWDGHAGQVVQ